MEKLRIIVGGYLGLLPAGGITWDYIQYPLGLFLLGHDVYYIEDTRLYPVYQKPGSNWNDCSSSVNHLQRVMKYFNLSNRWAYRDEASGKCFGLPAEKIKTICKTADLFINISCSTFLREEYLQIPKKVLIDTDPMFTQIQCLTQQMVMPGEPNLHETINKYDYLFTFGENIGSPECHIPDCGLQWIPTRQPVCLSYWKANASSELSDFSFTTLMNWTAAKTLIYNGQEWGQKDIEFKKYINLPYLVKGIKLSAIVNQTGSTIQSFSKENVTEKGWHILDPDQNAGDWKSYQNFISKSSGEFSVAKETYVKAKTGWFSCRSACYLAAGKPVITQDTGWSKFIPSGTGLIAFSDIEAAAEALKKVVAEPVKHMKAAREIAEEFFDSKKVLQSLIAHIN